MSNIIIGSSSFLGSYLSLKLEGRKEKVFLLSYRYEKDQSFFRSITDLLKEKEIRNIFICGSSQVTSDTPKDVVELFKSNIEMPGMICSLVKKYSPETAIITFGSSWQFNASYQIEPFNLYAASKSAAEDIFEHYALDGIKICSLRLYDTYGLEDSRPKIVNLITNAIKSNEKLKMSNGEQSINLVHIKDVINAVIISAEFLHKNFNNKLLKWSIKSEDSIQLKEIIEICEGIVGKDLKYLFDMGFYPYRTRERFELSEKDKRPEGWSQKISLFEGLKELIE